MALGASRANVTRLILRQGILLSLFGLILGLGGAIAAGRAMQSALYGIGTLDSAVIAAVAMVLFVTALFASYLPPRRAASSNPMQALRSE
jgi:ABC-type antimicrobial peptide transport system permease subunit